MLRQWGFARPKGFGGTGLFGSIDSVIGSLFGLLLIDMATTALSAGLDVSQQQIICGLIIIQLRWRERNDG